MPNIPTNVVNTFAADITALESDVTTLTSDLNDATADLISTQATVATNTSNLLVAQEGQASSSALQSATTSDKENEIDVELHEGYTDSTSTLNIIDGTGGGWRGKGNPGINDAALTSCRNNSILRFTGTKTSGVPHILYERSDFYFEHCAFYGKSSADILADTGTNTDIGIKITRAEAPYDGVGTGKLHFNNVTFAGYNTAIHRATAIGDANCDENSYYNVLIARCGSGFKSMNAQGLSDVWYNLRVGNTDVMFDYYAGGKLDVIRATIFQPCSFLKLRNSFPAGYGPNGSRWVFRGTDLDSQARNTRLLDCEAGMSIYGHVIFDGVHLSRNGTDVWDNECWNVGDNVVVTIRDCFGLMPEMIKVNSTVGKTTVILEDSIALKNYITVAEDLIHPDSTGTFRFIVRNLFEVDSFTQIVTDYNETLIY